MPALMHTPEKVLPPLMHHRMRATWIAQNTGLQSAIVAITVVATMAGGCKPGPEFAEVTGTVTIDGVPAAGVQVSFEPQTQNPREILPAAYGMTNADGVYKLLRRGRDPGAPLGLHHVRMTPVEQEGAKNTVIHPRYQANNALWAEVTSGKNVIDFELLSGSKSKQTPRAITPAE